MVAVSFCIVLFYNWRDAMTIGILGFGTLGSMIAQRLINTGINPMDISVVERPSNRTRISALGVRGVAAHDLNAVDVLILTTKPNQFERAWKAMGSEVSPTTVVLSFMAKTPLENIIAVTQSKHVVRAMTSTPCVLGLGIGAWIAAPTIGSLERERAQSIIATLGSHIEAEIEDEIAIATVLSSINGMLYVLVHAMEQALNDIGASKRYQKLVVPLIESALAFTKHRGDTHLIALADEVTSPNGTTAALRHVLARAGITAVITEAVRAAYEKAKEAPRK